MTTKTRIIKYEDKLVPVVAIDTRDEFVCLQATDGSQPFQARVARADPEAGPYPEYVSVNWGWFHYADVEDMLSKAEKR